MTPAPRRSKRAPKAGGPRSRGSSPAKEVPGDDAKGSPVNEDVVMANGQTIGNAKASRAATNFRRSQLPIISTTNLPPFEMKSDDLNSSPVKSKGSNTIRTCPATMRGPGSDFNRSDFDTDCSSSPIKRKKMVVFSDDLVIPSSPRESNRSLAGELKSILKLENSGDQNLGLSSPSTWAKPDDLSNERNPSNPAFWHIGTIIQLAPGSPELQQLVTGIVNVLKDENFSRKFEVYAAMNHLCKVNDSETLYKLLAIPHSSTGQIQAASRVPIRSPNRRDVASSPIKQASLPTNHISSLCSYIRRDLLALEKDIFNQKGSDSDETLAENSDPVSASNTESAAPASPVKIDPFSTRIINQALKLMAFIMTDPELNNFISIEHSKWFYLHSCEMTIKPELSKTLVLSYLVILKDCRFSQKKKKQIFDNSLSGSGKDIAEQILFSLLNMKGFSSSSLVVEKFVALKNLIVNFPTMMAKNINHWFPVLIVNLCDLNSPLYNKIITMGIQTLLECARYFIDNRNVLFTVRKFMSSPLDQEVKSLSSEYMIIPSSQFEQESSASTADSGLIAFDFVASNLDELIRNGQYKSAMDIWVALTLLTSGQSTASNSTCDGYETWPFLSRWLKIHKFCFNQQDNQAKTIALTSWKAIVYNICHNDLDNLKKHNDVVLIRSAGQQQPASSNEVLSSLLKPKVKLLLHPLLNVTAVESQREIIDVLNNLFMSILYALLNPSTASGNSNPESSGKYIHVYWDKIVQPILANFYFRKDMSSSYMNELGVNIVSKLLRNDLVPTSTFNDLRCLSNEPVGLGDIHPLPSKWIFTRFDKIMQNLILVLKLDKLGVESKLSLFNTFLNSLKIVTKKEIKPSNSTCDIIDNLPIVLNTLFQQHNQLNFDQIYKILIGLNDTFGAIHLVGNQSSSQKSKESVYFIIATEIRRNDSISVNEENDLYGLMYTSIGDKLNIGFIKDLIRIEKIDEEASRDVSSGENKENQEPSMSSCSSTSSSAISNSILKEFYQPILNSRKINKSSTYELQTYSAIFQTLDSGFEVCAKRLIQDIVIGTSDEIEKQIGQMKIYKWTMPIFKYFVLLMHDAPHQNLKQLTLNLVINKWETGEPKTCSETLIQLVKFLVENRFNFEIFNLKKHFMKKYVAMDEYSQQDFRNIWDSYLQYVVENNNFTLLDDLLVASLEVNIDISTYIRNRWDKLPLLKKEFLDKGKELIIDKSRPEFPHEEAEMAAETASKSAASNKIQDKTKGAKEIDVDLDDEDSDLTLNSSSPIKTSPPVESPQLSQSNDVEKADVSPIPVAKGKPGRKPKAASKKKNTKTPTKKTPAKKDPPPNNFDIHSFTAMLTAKLSTPVSKKEKNEKREISVEASEERRGPSFKSGSQSSVNSLSIEDPSPIDEAADSIDSSVSQEQSSSNVIHDAHIEASQENFESQESSNSAISESLEDFQPNTMEFDENFYYEDFMKNELTKEKSPELDGTLGDESTKQVKMVENGKRKIDSEVEDFSSKKYKQDLTLSFDAKQENSPAMITDSNLQTESIVEISSSDQKESETEDPRVNDDEVISSLESIDSRDIETQAEKSKELVLLGSQPVANVPGTMVGPSSLGGLVSSISDDEIATLSDHQRFQLETELLQFMLRLRNIKS